MKGVRIKTFDESTVARLTMNTLNLSVQTEWCENLSLRRKYQFIKGVKREKLMLFKQQLKAWHTQLEPDGTNVHTHKELETNMCTPPIKPASSSKREREQHLYFYVQTTKHRNGLKRTQSRIGENDVSPTTNRARRIPSLHAYSRLAVDAKRALLTCCEETQFTRG